MYTKTPDNSTYSTIEIDLLKVNKNKSSLHTKDPNLINCYPEFTFNKLTKEAEVNIVKRPGYSQFIAAPAIVEARGMYYWKDQDRLYYAVSDDIYVYSASAGTLITTLTSIFGTSTGVVGFTEFLYESGTTKIVVTDGTTISTIDSANTVVTGVDGDQPTHLPIPIFLDGYLFIIKTNTADIYNSDNNNPLTYTAGNFINAEIEPDQIKSIVKLNNYLAVLGSNSIEYFWDAGIATGSPLQRNDVPVKQIGFLTGLAQQGNKVYFVGHENRNEVDIFVLEDLKVERLGDNGMKRYLSSYDYTYSSALFGTIVASNGHSFYVIGDELRTDVLELESQLWSQWKSGSGVAFGIKFSIPLVYSAGTNNLFVLQTGTTVYSLNADIYQDANTNFTVTVITGTEEAGTLNWKNMHRAVVWADYPTATQNLTIQWTDDDYQSYNTSQDINLYQDLPAIYQLGGFRQRAFKLTYTGNLPLRLKKIECEINKGTS